MTSKQESRAPSLLWSITKAEIFRSRAFFLALIFVSGLGITLHVRYGRIDSHLLVNAWHWPMADFIMPYITFFGDFLFLSVVAIYFLIRRQWRAWLQLTVSGAVTGLVAQALKNGVFQHMDRPSKLIVDPPLHLIDGVKLYQQHSFPSGHAAIAFTLALTLLFVLNRQILAIPLLILALLAAWSRVYLSQHFVEDILAGALLGSMVAVTIQVTMRYLAERKATKA